MRSLSFISRLLSVAACGTIVSSFSRADEWKIYRYEGRDYVSLQNVATFYAFPPPPPVDVSRIGPAPVLPVQTPPPAASGEEPAAAVNLPTFQAIEGRTILLDNGKNQLAITLNGREVQVNGVNQWLDFPAIVQDGAVLISRIDLAKTLEPRLRPEKVQGLGPVKTVVLDAGHGGHDNGAASRYGFEKNFALDVVLRTRDALVKAGFNVVLTRSGDVFVPLHERSAVPNHLPDSIFVSVHFNSAPSNGDARGFEIYSCAPRGAPATNDGAFSPRDLREEPGNAADVASAVLSGTVFHSLLGHVPLPDRGIKHARFAVLRLCTQPAILVECGFVSNAQDSSLISSPNWRQQVADALATGIENYRDLAEQHVAPKLVADYRRAATAGSGSPAHP